MALDPATGLDQPTKEQQQYALQLRHKLAMESIGLVRTCLNVQRPVFDALLELERNSMGVIDSSLHQNLLHNKSFALQMRLVKLTASYLDELNAISEEVICCAERERAQ